MKIEENTGEISLKAQGNANGLIPLENTDYRRNTERDLVLLLGFLRIQITD